MIFFDNSRPDREKRARREGRIAPRALEKTEIPPAKSYELLTADELLNGGHRVLIMDTESYPNYFLVAFKCLQTGKVVYFEDSPENHIPVDLLGYVLHRFVIVGFNSKVYDNPMLAAALQGCRADALKDLSNKLIMEDYRPNYDLQMAKVNSIDIINVAPLEASLKIYAGRLHCERMQDLPYNHLKELTKEEAVNVRDYCINDLDNTMALYLELLPHIELRERMGAEYEGDFRSKSDAQVAEAIIVGEIKKLGKLNKAPEWEIGDVVKYKVPSNIKFKTPQLQKVLEIVENAEFRIGKSGSTDCPIEIAEMSINIGNCQYRMGNGGLHSSEKSLSCYSNANRLIIDRDVAGYYPQIILNQGLFPEHIGPNFLTVYQKIVTRRLKAKKDGNKTEADGLKIAVNGSFGKLGNQYSSIYSPDLVTQVTISGQLFLLMLIEAIEAINIRIISANTDGIVIDCPADRYNDLVHIIIAWEEETGFITEETRYRSLHCRDVNNYIAVKEDGSCKTKGVYCEKGSALNSVLSKNPETLILSDAVQAFLSNNVPIRDSIYNCSDIRRFITVRTVKGGAEQSGRYLGKAIRWYYSKDEARTINYVLSGNLVPKSNGAKPLMILPKTIPEDLNYDYYVEEANQMLYDLGVLVKAKDAKLL